MKEVTEEITVKVLQ